MKKKISEMTLVERFQAESSEFGKWFTTKIPFILGLTAGAVETLEYVNALPEGLVPAWVKQVLLGLVLVAKFFGHTTVKKTESEN
jgi:hypothetical protein